MLYKHCSGASEQCVLTVHVTVLHGVVAAEEGPILILISWVPIVVVVYK